MNHYISNSPLCVSTPFLRSSALFSVLISIISIILMVSACRAQNSAAAPFTADISMSSTVLPPPGLSGTLYVKGNHLRADWGTMVEVFDLNSRKGWRLFPDTKVYQELGSKDLSTYAPIFENGSMCPHAEVPSGCKLVGNESLAGRDAKKWDLYNPNKGFHVYYWTDVAQSVTLLMDIGGVAKYQVTNVRSGSVPDSLFEFPAGYQKMQTTLR